MGIFDFLKSNNNPKLKINKILFLSPDHVRYEKGIHVAGPHGGASRGIKIEPNVHKEEGYTVTIYIMDGVHPVWGNNVQMAPKQMNITHQSNDKVVLRGFGHDAMGASFEDYGITINYKNGIIYNIILHMHDRNIDIKYLSEEELKSIDDVGSNSGSSKSENNGIVRKIKENGDIIEFNYKNGKKNGEWKLYYSSEKIKEIGNALNDESNGPWEAYYENGTLRAKGQFVNSNEHGNWKFYDEIGTLRAEGNYINGKQTGKWLYYDMFGKVEGYDNF